MSKMSACKMKEIARLYHHKHIKMKQYYGSELKLSSKHHMRNITINHKAYNDT
jgi:hypothetical protein